MVFHKIIIGNAVSNPLGVRHCGEPPMGVSLSFFVKAKKVLVFADFGENYKVLIFSETIFRNTPFNHTVGDGVVFCHPLSILSPIG